MLSEKNKANMLRMKRAWLGVQEEAAKETTICCA